MRELDDITGAIVDASLHIHRDLGPGLLESVYEAVLARALEGLRRIVNSFPSSAPSRLRVNQVVMDRATAATLEWEMQN
jgi:hypothetical protein